MNAMAAQCGFKEAVRYFKVCVLSPSCQGLTVSQAASRTDKGKTSLTSGISEVTRGLEKGSPSWEAEVVWNEGMWGGREEAWDYRYS